MKCEMSKELVVYILRKLDGVRRSKTKCENLDENDGNSTVQFQCKELGKSKSTFLNNYSDQCGLRQRDSKEDSCWMERVKRKMPGVICEREAFFNMKQPI